MRYSFRPMPAAQPPLIFSNSAKSSTLISGTHPIYTTSYGAAYLGDSLALLKSLPESSVDLVCTSPPYALHFSKEYGNATKEEYVSWFRPFAKEILRVLKPQGSFVLNVGGSYNAGVPTRSVYHYRLLLDLIDHVGFHLAQELFWYNPAKMPMPAEWVSVRRIRVKDSVEFVWWLSKTEWPKANNRNVLRPYSADMIRLNQRGLRQTKRPSGHAIRDGFKEVTAGGAIPPNVFEEPSADDFLVFGNNAANDPYTLKCKEQKLKIHPARFPAALPDFFVKLLTDESDLVLDVFAGSNTTGFVAEKNRRRWLAFELSEEYIRTSQLRFEHAD